MDIEGVLKDFGIEAKEALLYLAALELGEATASQIANKAGIPRTYFYDLSQKLIAIGLVKETRLEKRRLFLAVGPERLVQLQKERLQKLERALPELKALHNTKGQKPQIFYYDGREKLLQVTNDALNYKGEIAAFSTPQLFMAGKEQFGAEFIKKRVAVGNRVRIIAEVSPQFLELKKKDHLELRETRLLPKNIYDSEVEIGIYANHVSIVDYKEELGFIIESSSVAHTLKKVFEIVWNSGKIVE